MAHYRIYALRQLGDVAGKVGGLKRGLHLCAVYIAPQRHVGSNALVEHNHVLANHGNLCA